MANDVAKTVVEAGLVEDTTLGEFRRWGVPVPEKTCDESPDPMLVPSLLEHAMQQEEYVQIKETDLEVLQQYLKTQQQGKFYLDIEDEGIPITYGRTLMGEYILPWQTSKDLVELITSVGTFLETPLGTVRFKDARDLYYGDRVAFVICLPE